MDEITFETRVERHRQFLISANAPLTREHCDYLGDMYQRSVKSLRGKVGHKARFQRRAGLLSARVFFTLSRRAK